jgi:threonine/homoserine/homoserine lactone efflux protein
VVRAAAAHQRASERTARQILCHYIYLLLVKFAATTTTTSSPAILIFWLTIITNQATCLQANTTLWLQQLIIIRRMWWTVGLGMAIIKASSSRLMRRSWDHRIITMSAEGVCYRICQKRTPSLLWGFCGL